MRHAPQVVLKRPEQSLNPRPDPFVEEVFARNEGKKAWVGADPCSHLWSARLPGDPPPGHPIVIEAVDEYGKTLIGRLALEVTGWGQGRRHRPHGPEPARGTTTAEGRPPHHSRPARAVIRA